MYNFSMLYGFLHTVAILLIGSSVGQLNISLYRTRFDIFKIKKDDGLRRSCAEFGGSEALIFPLTSSTLSCKCTTKSSTFGLFNNVMGCYNFARLIGEEGCDVSLEDQVHLSKYYGNLYLLNSTDKCIVEQVYYLMCGGHLISLDYNKTNSLKQFEIISAQGPNSVKGFALKVESSVYQEHEGQIIKLDLKCDRKDRISTCLMFKVQGKASCDMHVQKLKTSAPSPSADYFQPVKRKPTTSSALHSRKTSPPSSPKTTFSIKNESQNLTPTSNSTISSPVAKEENKFHSMQASVSSIFSPKPRNKVPQDKRANETLSVPVLGAIAGTLSLVLVIVLVFVVRWTKFRKQSKPLGAQAGEEVSDYVEISNRLPVTRGESRASSNQGDYATVEVPIPKKANTGENYQSLGTKTALEGSYARLYNSPKEPRRMNQNGKKSSGQEKVSKAIPEVNRDYVVLEGPDPNIQKVGEPLYHVLEITDPKSTIRTQNLANQCT